MGKKLFEIQLGISKKLVVDHDCVVTTACFHECLIALIAMTTT